jgi:hypothetical protein
LLTLQGGSSKTHPTGYEIVLIRELVADPRRDYHLDWSKNPLFDDKTAKPVTVNDKGLLTNVELNTTDQTPGILTDLVDTTISGIRIAGGGAQSGNLKAALEPMPPFSCTFDPFDATERESVLKRLSALGVKVHMRLPGVDTTDAIGQALPNGSTAQTCSSPSQDDDAPRAGVAFHPPTTVELRLEITRLNLITRKTVTVPNLHVVAHFSFRRAPLVASSTGLTLVDGMPSGFTIDRPSPVKAFTGLLKTVTSTVASAVPTLVNVNVNREKSELAAERSLMEAQTNHLKAQQQLLKEQSALAGMQSAPAPPSNLSDRSSTKTDAEGAGPAVTPPPASVAPAARPQS